MLTRVLGLLAFISSSSVGNADDGIAAAFFLRRKSTTPTIVATRHRNATAPTTAPMIVAESSGLDSAPFETSSDEPDETVDVEIVGVGADEVADEVVDDGSEKAVVDDGFEKAVVNNSVGVGPGVGAGVGAGVGHAPPNATPSQVSTMSRHAPAQKLHTRSG
jgi:hypothetical protein